MLKRDIEIQKVWIIAGRTDMRNGVTGLAAQVLLCSGQDPTEKGSLFLFCGRRKDRIKGIMYEGDGFILINKRLTNGRFCWPESQERETKCLTLDEYDRLISGYTITSTIK